MIRPMNKPGVGERSCEGIHGSIQPLTAKFQCAHCVSKASVKDPAVHGSMECRANELPVERCATSGVAMLRLRRTICPDGRGLCGACGEGVRLRPRATGRPP